MVNWTVVTPSFGQLDQLECCIASVADQEGVGVEHFVQDGGTMGFDAFALKMAEKWPNRPGYQRIMISEKDRGMYDAINRGLAKARGSFCAYLNCDEQYLPDTLKKVSRAFQSYPEVDLFFGDTLVLDERGNARCWRKVLVPLVNHTWTCHFSAFTAAMFFRKGLWLNGPQFDITYRAAADAVWYLEARRHGARAAALGFFTSTFMETGGNLGLQRIALEERKRLNRTAPWWVGGTWFLWFAIHRIQRWSRGAWRRRHLAYSVYRLGRVGRTPFQAENIPGLWPGRWHKT